MDKPALSDLCARCGKTFGLHGFVDGRCPGVYEGGGNWTPAITFWKPVTPPPEQDGKA